MNEFLVFLRCIVMLQIVLKNINGFKYPSVERNLTRTLLDKYQFYGILGRPVNKSNEMIAVQYGLQLIQILNLDENQQILHTNCWSMYKWNDLFLRWDPNEYNGISEIRVFPDQIWTPDIKLYNFADVRLKEARIARVILKHTGEILWVPQAIFKSTCSVEITYFPFDTQICMLEFGSWTYDINQLDIQWWQPDGTNISLPYIDFSDYIISPEWETDGEASKKLSVAQKHTVQIRSVKKIRTRTNIDAHGNRVTKSYPVLRYLVRLRRNPSFYVSILIIPCILLSSLTMVVFWLPPESPAKMMLGMNIFVAFFVLLQLLEECTPAAVKKFPLIGAFFCLNMVMITLSTFLATLVINLYFKGHQSGHLPKLIRTIMLEGLGRLLFIRQHIPLYADTIYHTYKKQTYQCANGDLRRKQVPKFRNYTMDENLSDKMWTIADSTESEIWRRRIINRTCHNSKSSKDDINSPLLNQYSIQLEHDVKELKKHLHVFVERQIRSDFRHSISMEWRTLALVLDRLFFVLYISTILIAVITCYPSSTEPTIPAAYRD